MGDISDMMMEGILCQQCGVIMEDMIPDANGKQREVPGYPRTCDDCRKEDKPRPGA